MFERPGQGERAVLVHVDPSRRPSQETLQEFRDLATSAGATVLALCPVQRSSPDPGLFLGSGKVEEIREQVKALGADLVIFDNNLSPSQERNLEQRLSCRVLDRTGLILDIFAQRARSHEGKLQVELAQLRHLSTRLVRGWTHLERQKGGIGLRGPGETQLETDRRLLNQRIDQIGRRLSRVDSQREQGRRARRRNDLPTVSLVGYTNAGKSTLFNRLTEASVFAKDQLFATLDPTLRRLEIGRGEAVILADTVGFVSRLPHELVAAFKSTLQETVQADLLLHVIDAHSAQRRTQSADVDEVLKQIGAGEIPRIEVYNKSDLLDSHPEDIECDEAGLPRRVWVSAQTGEGMERLQSALRARFRGDLVCGRIHLGPGEGGLRAQLFRHGAIVAENHAPDGGWELQLEMPRRDFNKLAKQSPVLREQWKAD